MSIWTLLSKLSLLLVRRFCLKVFPVIYPPWSLFSLVVMVIAHVFVSFSYPLILLSSSHPLFIAFLSSFLSSLSSLLPSLSSFIVFPSLIALPSSLSFLPSMSLPRSSSLHSIGFPSPPPLPSFIAFPPPLLSFYVSPSCLSPLFIALTFPRPPTFFFYWLSRPPFLSPPFIAFSPIKIALNCLSQFPSSKLNCFS